MMMLHLFIDFCILYRLQILANKIMTEFVDATLSRDKYEDVKLHITLMNTIFREHLENKDSDERITFDASRIMKVNPSIYI